MAHEHDSDAEELQDIRQLVERIAKRMGVENPLPVAYSLACEYLDDDGERTWAIRYDKDQGYAATVGLAKMLELDADRIARLTLGLDEDE
jgi:hypothetical protein